MKNHEPGKLTRREILRAFLALPAGLALAACAPREGGNATPTMPPAGDPPTPVSSSPTQPVSTATATSAPSLPADTPTVPTTEGEAAPPATDPPTPAPTEVAQALPPTPACGDDDDDPTPPQAEGPFYTPSTPERNSLLEPDMPGTKMILTGIVLSTACQPIAGALLDFWHADDAGVYDNTGYRLRGHQFADDQGRYYLETIMPGLYPGRTRHFHIKVQAPNQPILTTQLYFPAEPGNNNDGIFNPALVMELQDAADGKAGAFNFVLNIG